MGKRSVRLQPEVVFFADNKKASDKSQRLLNFIPGDVLLSHTVSRAVPSALEGLTSEFGMGSGVAPPL